MREHMKKWFKLISLLVMIIVGAFTSAKRPFFFTASATYVEGFITQDTVWTLTDSPFEVSKNITVCPNVTLTIEPGVEVRFGGDFSLLIEGSLSASGEESNTIAFTSNKDQPGVGDWSTLKFNGTEPSTLTYCVVEYGRCAITIENSKVKIEDCEISNSLDGITIVNSTAVVKSNRIANNSENGIRTTGYNQVTIQDNNISSNTNGILLTGSSTTGVSITENTLTNNTKSGIQLDANAYNDVTIIYNILSANNRGFYVSGQANTYITKNYISNNTIGIFYDQAQDHVAQWNDIYCNDCGMDVSSNVTVSAEYNYWGHESGPYHISLNPAGKGNPVGGDGVNLDFIFFLTATFDYENIPPTAILRTDKTLVAPNQNVTFIGTLSSDEGRVDQYFFDFGDGINSRWTTLSIFFHNYSSIGTYPASLIVKDDFNETSTNVATATINVQDLTPLQVSLTASDHTIDSGKQVPLTVHVTDGTLPIGNVDIALLSITGGSFTKSSGLANSTGYFTTTFTAPNVTRIADVRIIASASKTGFADGSDYKYLEILPPLLVEVTEPTSVESEDTTTMTAHVTYNGQSVAEALVLVSADNGSFSVDTKFTNSKGDAEFNFTAPQTLMQQNITITATATKIGYLEGFCRATITVIPKMLIVKVAAKPAKLVSKAISNVIVHVTHKKSPVPNTTVTVSSDVGGSFSAEMGTTNLNGTVLFAFLAPPTDLPLEITVAANATKNGYISGEDYVQIIVYPGILKVEVTASRDTVKSGANSIIIVRVTCNATPVANANVEMSSDYGNFTVNTGITDSDGYRMFNFIAPQVTEELSTTITANARKNGYKSGEDRTKIDVTLEALMIEVIADPSVIKSEETANATVHVTYSGQLVADALVTIWSDGGGNFSAPTGTTDSNGDCTFVFTAPQTTTQLNITITAAAIKAGYADGQGQTKIAIEPKILVVELIADPITVSSEETSYVTVHVTYDTTPISDASIMMSSVYGAFSPVNGTTDSSGNTTFTFTAPQAITQLNVTITATATKTSYADGEGQVRITVNPRILDVQVTASPVTVESRDILTVTVHVTWNTNPVADAVVTVSSDGGGNFSAPTGTTDSNGDCTFVFTAPQTITELHIDITATATKTGYIDGESQTGIAVNPEVVPEPSGGIGLPLTTIIIIAVLIIMVAIVILLIKLKIIYISWKQR
jgi:parallel beta-helix repeat protein